MIGGASELAAASVCLQGAGGLGSRIAHTGTTFPNRRLCNRTGWAASSTDFCRRIQAGLAEADFARRRQIFELLIDRVVVTDGDVEIRYVTPLSPDGERRRLKRLVIEGVSA